MPNKFIFVDEAGCFTFNREPNVSRYFTLCTIVMDDCSVGTELLNLRRRLAWEGAELGEYFHATTDKQAVRDEVFKIITGFPFTVQATIMEKCKAEPQLRTTKERFYKHAFFYHFKFGAAAQLTNQSEALVTTASPRHEERTGGVSRRHRRCDAANEKGQTMEGRFHAMPR